MTLPEMGIMLCVDRNGAYQIVKENPQLEVIIIAGKKRVTIRSFEDWYASQEKYHKFVDLGADERERFLQQHVDDAVGKKIRKKYIRQPDKTRLDEKSWFSPEEVADIMAINRKAVQRLIQKGTLTAQRFGKQFRISKDEILWLMTREESKRTGGI
jgi:excisionase family DNA binding protein